MQRTTVMLPLDLKRRAQDLARRQGVSLGGLIRDALEAVLRGDAGELAEDPLYTDRETYGGPAPADYVADHDRYLYDDEQDG